MYTNKGNMLIPIGAIGPHTISGTGQFGRSMAVRACQVKRVILSVSTATTGATGTGVVKIRPTIGSSSGEVTVGTVTIPNLSAGAKLYKDFQANTPAKDGEEILLDVTVATGAGAVCIGFNCEEDPETAANQSSMVASA